jgi:hypothetical protein
MVFKGTGPPAINKYLKMVSLGLNKNWFFDLQDAPYFQCVQTEGRE